MQMKGDECLNESTNCGEGERSDFRHILQFGTTGLPNGWMSAGGGEDVRMPLEFPVILLRPMPLMSPQSYHLIATGSRPCSLRGSRTGGPACSSAFCAGADRAQVLA